MDVTLCLNHVCNLRCSYCYTGRKFHRPMDDAVMRKGIELAFTGPRPPQIGFFGGEPLLELDRLRHAIDYARELQVAYGTPAVQFYLATNGTLLDESTLNLLCDEGVHFTISIDGCREAHEATRPYVNGGSSFDVVSQNFYRAIEAMPSTQSASVIDPTNVHLIAESFRYLLELGSTRLNFTFDYGAEWKDRDLESLRKALLELEKAYVEAYRVGKRFSLDLFDIKIVTHLQGGYRCMDRCNFGLHEIAVAPSGALYPCERLVGEDNDTLLQVGHVEDGIDFNRIAEMQQRLETLDADCAICGLRDRCMHWCGCVNWAVTGDIGKRDGLLCRLEQLVICSADRVAENLFKERNSAFLSRFYRTDDEDSSCIC